MSSRRKAHFFIRDGYYGTTTKLDIPWLFNVRQDPYERYEQAPGPRATLTQQKTYMFNNGRTPVVQTGKYGENLGELVITLDRDKLQVESYKLHPIDDSIAGDTAIADEIENIKSTVTEVVFASRGYRIDQPLAVITQDLPNTFTDIAAGTLLANLVTDSYCGYREIDIRGKDATLYSLTCPLYLGLFIVAIPKFTKGLLTLVPKNKDGQPLKSRTEALDTPRGSTPDLLPPRGSVDEDSVVTVGEKGAVREIKEWQAIMDYLRGLPAKNRGALPTIPVDDRAAEVRAIQAGC